MIESRALGVVSLGKLKDRLCMANEDKNSKNQVSPLDNNIDCLIDVEGSNLQSLFVSPSQSALRTAFSVKTSRKSSLEIKHWSRMFQFLIYKVKMSSGGSPF